MKTTLYLLLILLVASCKKEPPYKDPGPVLTVKWNSNRLEMITKSYRNGAYVETKSNTTHDIDVDTWEFKAGGIIELRVNESDFLLGQNQYVHKGDSLIFGPGEIFPAAARAKIVHFTSVDLAFTWLSILPLSNGIDSTFITRYLYRPTTN